MVQVSSEQTATCPGFAGMVTLHLVLCCIYTSDTQLIVCLCCIMRLLLPECPAFLLPACRTPKGFIGQPHGSGCWGTGAPDCLLNPGFIRSDRNSAVAVGVCRSALAAGRAIPAGTAAGGRSPKCGRWPFMSRYDCQATQFRCHWSTVSHRH
jgi:hypothetical protein